jgi:16S rRNA (uracil1498-N3)-methyltransferase
VLRLRPKAALTLFNGRGGQYAASIERVAGSEVTVAVGEHEPIERESPFPLTLAQGVSRGERMDLVVQKATELGVARLVPVLTERSVVRLDEAQSDRKSSHWRAIAIAACEQCGRNRLPEVALPAQLHEFLRQPAGDSVRLLLSPLAELRIEDVPRPARGVTVLIGPEGGLADAEQRDALTAGFTAVNLGPRVLRTETAAIAALTLLQREFGDL